LTSVEQISMVEAGRIHQTDPFETQFAGALAGFPCRIVMRVDSLSPGRR
jgi:hypothetical protein